MTFSGICSRQKFSFFVTLFSLSVKANISTSSLCCVGVWNPVTRQKKEKKWLEERKIITNNYNTYFEKNENLLHIQYLLIKKKSIFYFKILYQNLKRKICCCFHRKTTLPSTSLLYFSSSFPTRSVGYLLHQPKVWLCNRVMARALLRSHKRRVDFCLNGR